MALEIVENCIIVDVSHWQLPSSIDWQQACQSGPVRGVIVKLMQGGIPDSAAVYHLYNAYRAGIPLLGIYDFGTASEDHVAFLKQALTEFGGDMSTRLLVIDAEKNPSNQMNVDGIAEWSSGIQASQGRWPVVYMGRDGPTGDGAGLPNDTLSKSDLWLPKYGPTPTEANLPPGFKFADSDAERGGVVRLWQFTGDGINPPSDWPAGIPANLDLSYACFSSYAALVSWWGT